MNDSGPRYWILFADIAWIAIALALAPGIRYGIGSLFSLQTQLSSPMLLASVVVWVGLYRTYALDGFEGGWHPAMALSKVVVGVLLLVVAVGGTAFFLNQHLSRLVMLMYAGLLVTGFAGIRLITSTLLGSEHVKRFRRRAIIVGDGRVARELAMRIGKHPELLCEIVGFLSANPRSAVAGERMASPAEVVKRLQSNHITDVIICTTQAGEASALAAACRAAGLHVSAVPHTYELYISDPKLIKIDGLPVISLLSKSPSTIARVFKPIFDECLGLVLALIAAPIVAIAAAGLWLRQGSVFGREIRAGQDSKPFVLYRLSVDRASKNTFARVLLELGITELPQLWNVLRRDMSLVGPRPESMMALATYNQWQRARLTMKPGITGLAQVNGLREHHTLEEKTRYDLRYMMRWTPFLDLVLLMQTPWTLLRRSQSFSYMRSSRERSLTPLWKELNADSTQPGQD